MNQIIFFLTLLIIGSYGIGGGYYNSFLQIQKNETMMYCASYNPDWYNLELPDKSVEDVDGSGLFSYPIAVGEPYDGCSAFVNVGDEDVILFLGRGNCTFEEKAMNVLLYYPHAVAVVIVSEIGVVPPTGNSTNSTKLSFPILMITNTSAEEIFEMNMNTKGMKLHIFAPISDGLDFNFLFILILASSLVICGSLWGNGFCKVKGQKTSLERAQEEVKNMQITWKFVLAYVGLACTMLVLLYFLYDYLVYIIIFIFCLSSATAIYSVFSLSTKNFPAGKSCKVKHCGDVSVKSIILTLFSLIIPFIWFVKRHSDYGWLLQNMLGIVIIFLMFKSVHLPSMKIATILLSLFFLYDIFFVFISPLLTGNGDSIMIKVATGGANATEKIPLTLMIPLFNNPFQDCGTAFSILGYGDIVLPGFFASYCLGFDLKKKSARKIYFMVCSIGYIFGLAFTYVGLYLMKSGQPALLYIVPSILIPVFIAGWKNGNLKELWTGKILKEYNNDLLNDDSTFDLSDLDFDNNPLELSS